MQRMCTAASDATPCGDPGRCRLHPTLGEPSARHAWMTYIPWDLPYVDPGRRITTADGAVRTAQSNWSTFMRRAGPPAAAPLSLLMDRVLRDLAPRADHRTCWRTGPVGCRLLREDVKVHWGRAYGPRERDLPEEADRLHRSPSTRRFDPTIKRAEQWKSRSQVANAMASRSWRSQTSSSRRCVCPLIRRFLPVTRTEYRRELLLRIRLCRAAGYEEPGEDQAVAHPRISTVKRVVLEEV